MFRTQQKKKLINMNAKTNEGDKAHKDNWSQ